MLPAARSVREMTLAEEKACVHYPDIVLFHSYIHVSSLTNVLVEWAFYVQACRIVSHHSSWTC